MAEVFKWIRPGFDLVNVRMEWNVQVPFLQTADGNGKHIGSSFFSSQGTSSSKWRLILFDYSQSIKISTFQYNTAERILKFVEPAVVKISMINGKGQKVLQQMAPSSPNSKFVSVTLTKKDIVQSEFQQADGSYIFRCKIFYHMKKQSVSTPGNPPNPRLVIDCNGNLMIQLEKLFEDMKFSDVVFNIGTRQFPAHKSILAARSEVFEAMFTHSTKEKLTNQIDIEDIEPGIFKELLRFIYTGRLNSTTMETMAAGLLIAADKYLLTELKNECENYLVRQMSPVNCVELILHGNLLNPAEHLKKVLKEAAKVFLLLPGEVMATSKWEKMEKENPQLLFKIQKILFSKNGVQTFV